MRKLIRFNRPLNLARVENRAGFLSFEGGGGKEGETESTQEEKLKTLQEWHDSDVAGLRMTNTNLKAEKKEAADALKALQTRIGDLDIDAVQSMMAEIDADEELKLVKEGGFKGLQQVVEARTANLKKDLESRLESATTVLDEKDTTIAQKRETIAKLTIDASVRQLGMEMDPPMDPRALSDAIRAARETFSPDDDDQPVAKKADGTPIIGKDGKTPLGLKEWLGSKFESKDTLWWGANSGGGAQGGGEGGGRSTDMDGAKNMSTKQKLGVGLANQSE